MGASAWNYFTAYKNDIEEALRELKEEVFRKKQYYVPDHSNLPATFEEWVMEHNLKIPDHKIETWKKDFYGMKERSSIVPTTIEELIKLNMDSGTHSILDISEISDSTDANRSGTISRSDLIRLFNTEMPDHDMIQSMSEELLEFRGRGFCTYLVVYKNGLPDEYFFTGYSGD